MIGTFYVCVQVHADAMNDMINGGGDEDKDEDEDDEDDEEEEDDDNDVDPATDEVEGAGDIRRH